MKKLKGMAFTLAISFIGVASAYDPRTHQKLSELSLARTSFYQGDLLWHLGISADPVIDVEWERLEYVSDAGGTRYKRIVDFIRDGAKVEDHDKRPLNHFFDPVFNRALEILGIELGERSVDWALEPQLLDDQEWSMRDAEEHFYAGLIANSESDAETHFGKAFRSTGQVIHHIQDMAQPQHTRNDSHCDNWKCELLMFPYEPSFYEWLSAHMAEGGTLSVGPSIPGNYPNVVLYVNRHYWTHPSGYGMADYSNRNFVTADTNFLLDDQGSFVTGEFASPDVTGWQDEDIDGATLTGRDGEPLSGFVRLVKAPVTDNFLGTGPDTTHYTSSYSMFAQDIRDAIDAGVPLDRLDGRNFFYLNRLNYQSANDHLYQRAIGYSAGFIDHVFRGRLEIAPPEGNIYSLIDHAVTNEVGGEVLEGFTSIKLKLRNATPQQTSPDSSVAIDGHVIKAGKLVAVALFRPNPCYTPDLHGELDEDGVIENGCSAGDWTHTEQHRVVSAEIDLPDGLSSTEFTYFEFDFSTNPIPVNARDLSIQVVFRGELGGDEDALAVARKDISEPTWFGGLNSTDYLGVDGVYEVAETFLRSSTAEEKWGIDTESERSAWGPQTIEDVAYFNHVTGERLTEWVPLEQLKYHRLAALAEPNEMLRIRSLVFYQTQLGGTVHSFTPIVTRLEERPEMFEIPGVGTMVRLVRQWYYTPIFESRGIPARAITIHSLHLGESPDIEADWALPAIPFPGPPEPIALADEG